MSKESGKNWLLAVFGMIFVLAGLAAAYGTVGKTVFGYVVSANWVEVPATIHHLEFVRNRGSDATTYSVESDYSYTFNGARYDSDRVSLSTGSDNLGSYWQDLHSTLKAAKKNNEVVAYVNANNPSSSLLDRTFRWSTVIFGSMFLFIFCGVGGVITWMSLKGTKSRSTRLLDESQEGIKCNQKAGALFFAGFGSIFFVMGTCMSLIILPDALRNGEYAALFVLLFSFIGAGIMYSAFRTYRAYLRFGPTPLFLDPKVPGVGGQLGGNFIVNNSNATQSSNDGTSLKALLTCSKKRKSGDSTSTDILWQEEAPVYLKQTANGVSGQFIFDVPEHCTPTKAWESRSSIDWEVAIEGEFEHTQLGKFDRSWEVHVEAVPAKASNVVNIPAPFLKQAEEKSREQAKSSALDQIPLTDDDQYISVQSEAGRHFGSNLMLLLFGLIFCGAGFFTIKQGWWPGYLFLLIGGFIAAAAVFVFGKSLEVKIDKLSGILYTRQSWFGLVYSHHQGELFDADQFKLKMTSYQQTGKKRNEYYAVNFNSDGKDIRVAERITGKKAAEALRDLIIDRCFEEKQLAQAA